MAFLCMCHLGGIKLRNHVGIMYKGVVFHFNKGFCSLLTLSPLGCIVLSVFIQYSSNFVSCPGCCLLCRLLVL